MSMRSELGESPAIVEGLLDGALGQVRALAREVAARDIDLAVIAARGTSDHAALYGQYILGARNRLLVAPAAPSLVSLYGAAPRLRNALVLGISQSGKSPDVVAVIEESRRQGALTAAITNDPQSELALAAEHIIELEAGAERAVAATKTYLAEIAVLAMLSAALSGDDASVEQLRALPDALRAALTTEADVAILAEARAGDDECAILARGFHYATAREWALKLKELAYVLADPYSAADFQHGPIALVHPGMSILGVDHDWARAGGHGRDPQPRPGCPRPAPRTLRRRRRLRHRRRHPLARRARVAVAARRHHSRSAIRLPPGPGARSRYRSAAEHLESD